MGTPLTVARMRAATWPPLPAPRSSGKEASTPALRRAVPGWSAFCERATAGDATGAGLARAARESSDGRERLPALAQPPAPATKAPAPQTMRMCHLIAATPDDNGPAVPASARGGRGTTIVPPRSLVGPPARGGRG